MNTTGNSDSGPSQRTDDHSRLAALDYRQTLLDPRFEPVGAFARIAVVYGLNSHRLET